MLYIYIYKYKANFLLIKLFQVVVCTCISVVPRTCPHTARTPPAIVVIVSSSLTLSIHSPVFITTRCHRRTSPSVRGYSCICTHSIYGSHYSKLLRHSCMEGVIHRIIFRFFLFSFIVCLATWYC